jgi:hypothetical protein
MANTYDLGDVVRLIATFTDTGGTLADPTTVTFTYGSPLDSWTTEVSGISTGVTNPSTGVYTIDLLPGLPGVWPYKVNSTGLITTASESYFRVRHPRVSS